MKAHVAALPGTQELEEGTPLLIFEEVLGHYVAHVHPVARPSLEQTPFPLLTVDNTSFVALPLLDITANSAAIWFNIPKLDPDNAFIPPLGQAHNAPVVARSIAEKMGGTIAFWSRTTNEASPDSQCLHGDVGIRFACLVPRDATLIKGTFEGVQVNHGRQDSFKTCAHCHFLAHKRQACPTAPVCYKCQATNTHAPRFCDAFTKPAQLPKKITEPSSRYEKDADGFSPAAAHSKLNGLQERLPRVHAGPQPLRPESKKLVTAASLGTDAAVPRADEHAATLPISCIYIDLSVDDVSFTALVDGGSPINIMSPALCARIALQATPINTVNVGSAINPEHSIACTSATYLPVKGPFGQTCIPFLLGTLPDEEVILGRPFALLFSTLNLTAAGLDWLPVSASADRPDKHTQRFMSLVSAACTPEQCRRLVISRSERRSRHSFASLKVDIPYFLSINALGLTPREFCSRACPTTKHTTTSITVNTFPFTYSSSTSSPRFNCEQTRTAATHALTPSQSHPRSSHSSRRQRRRRLSKRTSLVSSTGPQQYSHC